MKIGNDMAKIVGERDMHPVTVTIGGMLKTPTKEKLLELRHRLQEAREDAIETVKLFASLQIPNIKGVEFWFSLKHPVEYAMIEGDLVSAHKRFHHSKLHDYIKEYHEPYSTANFVVREGRSFMVGALPRVNNNWKQLYPDARRFVENSSFSFPTTNPFVQNFCQAVEILHCIDHAIQICTDLDVKRENPVSFKVKAGHGIACTEAPRGLLWHEYEIDEAGVITRANIVTPTAQNLRSMNDDIRQLLPGILDKPREDIVLEVEKLIRAYDPCFSCSTHFLKVKWL
jgi:coenzyme F420-reducing hydrogenase alpha subunit